MDRCRDKVFLGDGSSATAQLTGLVEVVCQSSSSNFTMTACEKTVPSELIDIVCKVCKGPGAVGGRVAGGKTRGERRGEEQGWGRDGPAEMAEMMAKIGALQPGSPRCHSTAGCDWYSRAAQRFTNACTLQRASCRRSWASVGCGDMWQGWWQCGAGACAWRGCLLDAIVALSSQVGWSFEQS